MFDRSKQDTVVIFVENELSKQVFKITAGTGLDSNKDSAEIYSIRSGVSSLITLNLNSVNGEVFDSSKTYMKAEIDDTRSIKVKGEEETVLTVDELEKYFKINPLTAQISNGYTLGQIEINTNELEKNQTSIEVPIKLSVYLNLGKYFVDMENTSMLSSLITFLSNLS